MRIDNNKKVKDDNIWYVYEHTAEVSKYIGMGTGGDAWNPDLHDHSEWMLQRIHGHTRFVRMWLVKATKEEAAAELPIRIKKNAPENYQKSKSQKIVATKSTKKSSKKGIHTPEGHFEKLTQAAVAHGLHPTTISVRCKSKDPAYKEWRRVK